MFSAFFSFEFHYKCMLTVLLFESTAADLFGQIKLEPTRCNQQKYTVFSVFIYLILIN